MTTDNRTNEPTDEQVEAAAKAIADCHNPGMFEKYPENWRVEASAALVAAQGAAPVLPSNTVDKDELAKKLEHWIFQYNQERITLKTFARAVVEAIGGEGR